MKENYASSRSLLEFEVLGERFRIVRRRFSGKPWRGYCMALCRGVPITDDFPQTFRGEGGARSFDNANPEHWRWYVSDTVSRRFGEDSVAFCAHVDKWLPA